MNSRVLKCCGLLNSVVNPHCSRGAPSLAFWIVVKVGCYFIYVFSCFPTLISSGNVFLKTITRVLFLWSSLFCVTVSRCLCSLRSVFFGKKKKRFASANLRNSSVCIFCGWSPGAGCDFWFTVFFIMKKYRKQQRNFQDFLKARREKRKWFRNNYHKPRFTGLPQRYYGFICRLPQ